MFDGAPISYWLIFHGIVVFLIVVDLLVLGRSPSGSQTRQNLFFVLFLLALAAVFGVWVGHAQGHQLALEFASGYLIELSLSIDNLFVFLLLFRSFGMDTITQRKALMLGILGAIVMRGIFIFAGIQLLKRFEWLQYIFGAFLLVVALRLLRSKKGEDAPGPAKYITRWTKGFGDSPKAVFMIAVLTIEAVDLVFALDSVPAVLAISNHPFVVYTSNIFAILGLRSLYFLLAGMLDRLKFLHLGLAAIIGFVGAKMMLAKWVHVPVGISLGVIVLVVMVATAASLLAARGGGRAHG